MRRLTLRTLAPQIKVRDLSNMSVTASPADYNSWEAVRNELMSEAKKGLKARVESELASSSASDDLDAMKLAFRTTTSLNFFYFFPIPITGISLVPSFTRGRGARSRTCHRPRGEHRG